MKSNLLMNDFIKEKMEYYEKYLSREHGNPAVRKVIEDGLARLKDYYTG